MPVCPYRTDAETEVLLMLQFLLMFQSLCSCHTAFIRDVAPRFAPTASGWRASRPAAHGWRFPLRLAHDLASDAILGILNRC